VKDLRTEMAGRSAINQAFAGVWRVLEMRNLPARFSARLLAASV
jgi:hypothetical protein